MDNFVQDGNTLDLLNSSGSTVSSGGVVTEGKLSGIACNDITNGSRGPCKMNGVFNLSVKGEDGSGDAQIAIGGKIYLDTDGELNGDSANGEFFGYNFSGAVVASGETSTIAVYKPY